MSARRSGLGHRTPHTHRRTARLVAHLLGLLALVTTVLAVAPPAAEAAVRSPFDKIFSTQDNGAITIVGNSQMTCLTSATGCPAARSGSGSSINNNNYVMGFQDVDGDSTTTNSTTADLAMPAGSTVLYARLLWGARMTAGTSGVAGSGSPGTVKLKAPGATAYTTVNGAVVRPGLTGTNADPYQASLDVTSVVQAAGNGTYSFADIVGATGQDRYAGWSLIVAYRNASLPVRDLSVFQGFADVTTESSADSTVSTTVSGFLTPATGAVNATVGLLAWEGDAGTTGDVLKFNGTTLSDSGRPSNNSFDSRISDLGSNITARNPNDSNNFGVDMGRVSANGVLANNQTSATVSASTTGDYIYLGALTTEIDLYTPAFVGVTKTVTDLSGNSPAKVGDTLEYRLSFTNSGQDYADNVVVRDALPANLTYVPGSLAIASGANAGAVSDASDADVGEYVDASRLVRVRLGTGAGGSTGSGGTVPVGAGGVVTFQATIDRAAAGSSIVNGSNLDYRARTLARDYTYVGNTVTTPVQAIADLGVTVAGSPTSQTAGSSITYTVGVTNNGPAASTNVVTTNTLPAGTTYSSSTPPAGTSCSASGQTVTCTTATLANGASLTIPIVAAVAPGTAAGTLVDQAGVTADTTDDVAGNNTATTTSTVTRSADLALTNTGPSTVTAGSLVTYTLTATNAGPSTATATTVTDALPVGVTLVSTNPSQGSCSADSQTVTCALGALAPGGSATVTVVGRVSAASTATSLANPASVSSSTPDPTSANNSATATTTVSRLADLSVTQTANAGNVVAGNTAQFIITTTNNGPSDAAGVTVTDGIPSDLVVISATSTVGSCTTTSGSVSCALGTLTPGTSGRVTVLVQVPAAATAGVRSNTANAATTTAESSTANNSATASITVVSQADLTLTKTASPDPVQPGTNLTYTLTASNAGPSRAAGVSIVDTLPDGTSFVASGSSGSCSASGQTVTCTVGTIDAGSSAVRTVVVSTPGTLPAGSSLVNQAGVTSSNDPDTTNNAATYSSSLDPQADLAVTTAGPATLVAGSTVTYTTTATNNGPSAATGVTVTDTVPAGVAITSVTASNGGACSTSGQTVTCTYASLAAAATRTITVVGTLGADANVGSSTNTATVAANGPTDPTTSNNTASTTANVSRNADLGVQLTAVTPTVRAGDEATYRVVVTNAGPSTGRNVVVTGQVPDGLDPVAGSSGGLCTVTGRTVTCPLGTVPVGTLPALTLRAVVRPSTPAGVISGTASIGASTQDANPANNSDDESITVTTAADMQAGQTVDPSDLVAGGRATYVLTATNAGPSDATGVTLTDTLPAGLTLTSVSPNLGTCTVTGQTISCSADRLAPGAVLTVQVRVDVDPALTGSVDNTVRVGSAVSDPQAGNDAQTTTSQVVVRADLRLGLTANPGTPPGVVAGNALSYSLTAVNTGPSTADGVVLEDTLPAGVVLQTDQITAPPGVTCTVTGRTVRCPLGNLAPGDTAAVTLLVRVPADVAAGTDLVDDAALDSTTPDVDVSTRSASVTTGVVTRADLGVTLSPQTASPVAGAPSTYVVTVANNGPSVAQAASLTQALPDGFAYDSSTNPAGTCSASGGAGRTVTCDLGDLAPGEVVTLTLTATVDPAAAGQQATTTATVSSSTTDPTAANDTASVTQTISAQNDLDLAMRLLDGPLVAGRTATYRITVTNNGPSLARQVSVLDQIPDGLGYVSATAADGGSCLYEPLPNTSADDDRIRCTWDTVAVGDSTYVDLVVSIPDTYPEGQSVTNTATAASNAVDPSPASATTTDTVGTAADLSAIKTLLSGPPVAGEEIRWQVTVDNPGPSIARAVTLSDPDPTGVTLTEAQTGQGTCTVDADGATCTLGDLAVGSSAVVTLSGLVDEGFAGGSIDNTATVDSPTTDPTPGNNDATISTPLDARADLHVVTANTAATATAGSDTTWTVTVTNHGPSAATQVIVSDTLPTGVTRVSQSLSGPGSGAGTCTVTPVVRCTVPSLASGATIVLTVVGTLDASYAGTAVENDGSATSAVADPQPVDNSDSSSTPVARSADVAVTMTGPATATAGTAVTWQVTVANGGPSDATGVVLTDTLPDGLLGATATFPRGTCQPTSGGLSCPLGLLAAGASVVVTVDATVAPGAAAGTLVNRVAATAQTADPDDDDLTASTSTTVDATADLSIDQVATTDLVAGQAAAWRITVSNAGPSLARGVVVREVLPDDVGQVTSDTPGCTVTGRALTCTAASLAAGAALTITLNGVVASGSTATSLATTATVEADTPDPDATNDSVTTTDDVSRSADLGLTMALTSGTPVAGAPVAYRLTVTNRGPSTARGARVVDDLPADITQASATSADGTCAVAGGTVTCDLDAIPDGGTATITITGTLAQAIGDDLVNSATVTATTPDPDDGDNTATAEGSVNGVADFGVTMTGPTTVVAGTAAGWTVVVRNAGPSTAQGATLVLDLPDGVADVTIDAPAGVTCTADGACTLGDLAAGQSLTVQVTATVGPGQDGAVLTTKAVVDSTTADPSSTDAQAVVDTVVTASADLSVTVSSDPSALTPGVDSTYTLRVANQGPSSARAVRVTTRLPEGMRLVGGGPSGPRGECTVSGRDVTCTLGVLAPGDAVEFSLPVQLDPSYTPGSVDLTAAVTSATADPDASGDTATLTTIAAARADLTLRVTAPARVDAGTPLTWTLQLSNDGPSAAQAVVITQELPAGIGRVSARSDQGTCGQSGGILTCTLGVVAAGASLTVDVTTVGDLDPSFDPGTIALAASASSPTPDVGPSDPETDNGRTASADTVVDVAADVSVSKTPTTSTAVAGGPVGWLITVVDQGPSTARGVVLTDADVPGVEDAVITPPAGVTCSAARECDIGTLLPGPDEALVFTVTGTLASGYADDTVVNDVDVTASTPDDDAGDNRASGVVVVGRASGVSVVKSATSAYAIPGGQVTWSVTVHNEGPSAATGVAFTDVVPDGVTDVAVAAPAGVDCAGTATVTCTVGTLGVGADATVVVTGTLSPDYEAGTLSNTARVTTTSADPEPADDTSTSTQLVTPGADVSITKTADTTTAIAGRGVTWTLTVANDGPATARGVTVTDPVPSGVTLGAVDGCEVDGGVLVCELGSLEPGQSRTLTVPGRLAPTFPGDLVNTATVGTSTADPDAGDNTATSTTPVTTRSDLSLVKRVDDRTVRVGSTVTFRIRVTNAGPSTASAVAVDEQWPGALQLLSVSPSQGTYDTAADRWAVGDLAVDTGATLVLRAKVTGAGTITNTAAIVGAADTDPRLGDNDDQAVLDASRAPGGTTATSVDAGSDGDSDNGSGSGSGSLPDTGGPSFWLGLLGLAALVAGVGFLLSGRGRRTTG